MKKEKLKFVGFRLYEKHKIIIRKWAKIWNVSESEALRTIIEHNK